MEKIELLQKLEEGDRILFEGRKQPLTVEKVTGGEVFVEGPNGGEYKIYSEEDAKHFLIAKPGNERYSSYCKNLRRVGEWQKKDNKTWVHSDTSAKVELFKNQAGFWNVRTENFDEELDLPKYGFSNLENAEEEATKIVENNPEG